MSGPAGALGRPGAGGAEVASWNTESLQRQRGGSATKADQQDHPHLHLFRPPLPVTWRTQPGAEVSLKTGGEWRVHLKTCSPGNKSYVGRARVVSRTMGAEAHPEGPVTAGHKPRQV